MGLPSAYGSNEVVLAGRVIAAPRVTVLPSGAEISTFRMVIPRERTQMTRGSKVPSDWFDCTAWTARCRRTVSRWEVGDHVQVRGSVRRRHVRGQGPPRSVVEIEVRSARRAVRPPAENGEAGP